MEQIFRKAYAKINLGLDVLRRREDGYHELRMIMQTVDICDDLLFERTAEPGIAIRADREELPLDRGNLIYRAAELLFREKKMAEGVRVTLTKRIPIAAAAVLDVAVLHAHLDGRSICCGMPCTACQKQRRQHGGRKTRSSTHSDTPHFIS